MEPSLDRPAGPSGDRPVGRSGAGHRRALGASVALGALAVAQAAYLYERLLVRYGELTWDPAYHSLWGWKIRSDVVTGRWISLAIDTYQQVYWPFMHSWLEAGALIVLGPTATSTRLVSLLAYLATGLALVLLARPSAAERRDLAAAVALGLWLTAGAFTRRYAVEAYTETLAIAVTAAALLTLARALRLGSPRAYAWAGVMAMATYFTKTDYGILLMLATAAGLLIPGPGQARLGRREMLGYVLPIVLLSLLWFAYPPKIAATIDALVNRQQGPELLSAAGLLYHVQMLVHWSDGAWVFVLLAVALAASLCRPGTPLIRVVAFYVVIALLAHTLSQTKDEKHIVKVLPWLFLLAGVQASWLFERLDRRRRRSGADEARPAGKPSRALAGSPGAHEPLRASSLLRRIARGSELRGAFMAGLIVVGLVRGMAFAHTIVAWSPDPDLATMARALADRVDESCSTLVIGEFPELSPHLLNWKVLTAHPGSTIRPDPFLRNEARKERLDRLLESARAKSPIVAALESSPSGPVFRLSHVFPKPRAGVPTDAPGTLDRLLASDPPDRILVVTVEPGSRYDTGGYRQFMRPGGEFLGPLAAWSSYRRAGGLGAGGLGLVTFELTDRSSGACPPL